MSETFMVVYTIFNFFLQGLTAVFFILQDHSPRFRNYLFSMIMFPITQFVYRTITNMIPGFPAWASIAFGFFGLMFPCLASCKYNSFADLMKTSFITYICFLIGDLVGTYIGAAITGVDLISENNYNNYNDIYVVTTPICALIILICFEAILLFRIIRGHQNPKVYLILLSVTIYQLILMAVYFQSAQNRGLVTAIFGLVITIFTMLLGYLIHRYAVSILEKEKAARILQDLKAKYEAEYLLVQEIEARIENIRSHRHDYMNQLNIIQHMITTDVPENETSDFINQIIESISS